MRGIHALAAAGLALGLACGSAEPAPRPNVVLVVADDLGWGDLGVQGARDVRTPRLDALAGSGVRFAQAYATAPLCAPSRAALLTGRDANRYDYTRATGPYQRQLEQGTGVPASEPLLAERLRAAGYATAAVGKWHLGLRPQQRPLARGFDRFFGVLGGAHDYFDWSDRGWGPVFRGDEPAEGSGYLTHAFTDEAVRFLREPRDAPFFLYLAYTAPHAPIQPPPGRRWARPLREVPVRQRYAAMVASLDAGVGAVLDTLEATGASRDTLVIFLSDHGGQVPIASNGPFDGGKGSLKEGGLRVPLLLAWPRALPGGRVYEPAVSALDVVPTVLAAAGLEAGAAPSLDGVDLLPYLRGAHADAPHATLHWRWRHGAAVRAGSLKLVDEFGREALYDLEADPAEQRDLAGSRRADRARLRALLDDWIAGLGPVEPADRA